MYDSGYSMYTLPSDILKEQLKTILPGDIEKLRLSPREMRDMEFCNLGVEQLVGYCYDKNGNIFFISCILSKILQQFLSVFLAIF
jgi:hypothetical protein